MDRCVYCNEELLFPWEKRRFDCDKCNDAIHITYYEDHAWPDPNPTNDTI